jgi:biopolymer transport protein ExbD
MTRTVVQSATWFYGPEGPGQGGIRFKVEDQIFNFPDTATEEEVESQIRSWLAENRPDKDYVVDITIERDTDAEGRERVKVMADIHEVGEESHEIGVQSPAHPPVQR